MPSYKLLVVPSFFVLAAAAENAQPQQALLLNQRGLEAVAQRDYPGAEKSYRAAVEIYRSLGERFETHLSITLFNLAEAISGQGKLRESDRIFHESLDLSRSALGSKNIRTLAGLNALGHVEVMLGDFDGAESRFAEALALARESYPRDIQLAYALAGLSSLRLRTGKPDEALPYAEEALRVTIEAEPREGVETALMYENVGQIHRTAGRSERALPLLRKALAIYEQAGAGQDPRYATTLSQEGLALMDQGKYARADSELRRAIGLLERCNSCRFELAIARNNLGLLRISQKRYAEADELLQKALMEEEIYSPADAAQIGITKNALQKLKLTIR